MTIPANQPINDVWVGNDYEKRLRAKNGSVGFDLAGSKIVFVAKEGGSTDIRKATDGTGPEAGVSLEAHDDDPPGVLSMILLEFTVTETRAMATGDWRYEIERWIDGKQRTLFYGTMTVTAWVNDDVDP